ncbi:Chitinase 2 [Coemansia sp. RSA 1722]|nr:Chitinase 2 [Coemansia sp. RSA 486]KAJ2235545.1 Chitinase 2 [Coemansia sp. RSA 485]KAJ2591280.1 Chitinase 2 [Coemansia sp. RSA 1722]
MKQPALLLLAFACYASLACAREFNIHCNSNLVMYWGQNSHGTTSPGENQLPLDEYCDKEAGDLLVLSFLSEFNADGMHPPTLNLANSCLTTFDNSTLLHCPNIGKAIEKCQKRGKAVVLSLGGASGAYGFSDDIQAERYADEIWDMFLGGNSQNRPFDNAVLDGIDLDIEGGSSIGYVRFVQRLRERFTESPGRRFYVTAAPQCPYPDFYTGPILDNAYLDMVFVQFYNNYCGIDKANWFNFEQWHEWATTISANKDVRVYLGVPGSPSAASSGYTSFDRLEELVNATRSKFSTFGGMMVWDASQADSNIVDKDLSFVDLAKRLLDSNRKCSDDSDKVVETVTDPGDSSASSISSSDSALVSSSSSATATKQSDTDTLNSSSTGSATSAIANLGSTTHSSSSVSLTKVHEKTTTTVDDDGTATVLTHVDVSEVTNIDQQTSASSDKDDGGLALEQLNRVGFKHMAVHRMAVDSSDDPAGEDASLLSSTDDSDSTSTPEAETETETDSSGSNSSEAETTDDSSESGSAESNTDSSEETTEEESADQSHEEETEDGNETTTMETTKVLFTTTTKTRKVHVVTKQVTKRIRKHIGLGSSDSLTDPSPSATTNKTASIITPTFPLPIARCPRADQPCIGAGFACNGYEFGQCVNNRWLMRPCSTDRVTACFNAGPDLVACDFPKGRSLQVCDDILAPLPYGRLASNVLFLRSSDQERALNTPVYPVPSSTVSDTTHVKKKKDDDDDDEESEDDDEDYVYNKYGEKKKNTATSTVTDMELVKQSSGVNLIDDHNRREDPAMLMVKDPAAYFGPDGHVRVVGGNVVDDLRKHNSFGTSNEPYDENPPVDDPEEADEYSEGDEFMRKRDFGAWDEELQSTASSAPSSPQSTTAASGNEKSSGELVRRDASELVGASVSMAHLGEKPWRAQLEDFYAIYALYSAFSGISNDMIRQQFERAIMDHIDGDFIIPPKMAALEGRPMLAHFTFMPLRGEDDDYKHYLAKDGQVEEDILVTVRMLTNIPIPKRWRIALPLPLNATMLHTSRGSFYAGDRVSAEVKSMYVQRVAFYNDNIRLNTNKQQVGPELQRLNDLAAGHSSNATEAFDHEFSDGPNFDSIRRNLISPSVISQILHKKPASPPPPELLDEPVANDPAGRLYEVRSDPNHEKEKSMALSFVIRVKTHPSPGKHVVSAIPHPILSFITTY